jgi:hypothetical protein
MADVNHPLVAGEALGSGVGGWCGKVVHGGLLSGLSGLRGVIRTCGAIFYVRETIITRYIALEPYYDKLILNQQEVARGGSKADKKRARFNPTRARRFVGRGPGHNQHGRVREATAAP